MAIFPKRWQKVLFALLIITTIVARLPTVIQKSILFVILIGIGWIGLVVIADYARVFHQLGKADA